MGTTARLDLSIWRNDDVWEYVLKVIGADMTGAPMHAQIRLRPDTPGAPLVDLPVVTDTGKDGVRLANVRTVGTLYENDIRIQLTKATRQALPYAGEMGDSAVLAWAFQLSGVTRVVGNVVMLAHAIGSDNAPTNRPTGSSSVQASTSSNGGAVVTITADNGATLVVDDAAAAAAAQATAATLTTTLSTLSASVPWVAALPGPGGAPILPTLQVDLDGQRCWLVDGVAPTGDVVVSNGDGSDSIADAAAERITAELERVRTDRPTGYTVVIDYSFPDYYTTANPPSGCVFSMGGVQGQGQSRFEMMVQQTATPQAIGPAGCYQVSTLLTALGFNSESGNHAFSPDTVRIQRMQGIRREIVSVPLDAATPVRMVTDAGVPVEITASRQVSAAPMAIAIGRRVFDAAVQSANVTVHQVTIYAGALSGDALVDASIVNERGLPPLLMVNDSLGNNGQLQDAFLLRTKPLGYVPTTWEGLGSRGLLYFSGLLSAMVAAHPRFAGYVLELGDYGLDTTDVPYGGGAGQGPFSALSLLAFLRTIRKLFVEPRWLLLESTPNTFSGAVPPTTPLYDQIEGAYRTAYPSAWTPWVGRLQAETIAANGRSADDEYAYNVAHEIVPAVMLGDPVHPSWLKPDGTPGGYAYLAEAAVARWAQVVGVGA